MKADPSWLIFQKLAAGLCNIQPVGLPLELVQMQKMLQQFDLDI